MKSKLSRHHIRIPALTLLTLVFSIIISLPINAGTLTSRRISIGTSVPSSNTTHNYSFNLVTAGNVGSIRFLYCSNSPFYNDPCTAPAGLNISAVTLDSQVGEVGFSVDPLTNANQIVLSRPTSAVTLGPVAYSFSNAINPSTPNISTFVRIATFASSDTSGSNTDEGATVFSTAGSFDVGAFVPPRFIFCVGQTVALNCSSTGGQLLSLGELNSASTKTVTSQFAVSTNAATGYSIQIFGNTLTSGNNIIQASAIPSPSLAGFSQFGMNLRANTSPSVGQDVVGGSGNPSPNYNAPNQFTFNSGDIIASSAIPTDFVRFTNSFIVNVADSQRPGVYSTTLQYFATATF